LKFIYAFILGYIAGNFPSAYIVTYIKNRKDIRKLGDGNPGAENTFKNVGKIEGVIVAILDFAKGFIIVAAFKELPLKFTAGVGVVLGHDFPVIMKFYGGKAMASTLGILTYLMPIQTIIGISSGLILTKITKKWEFSMSIAFMLLLILALIFGYEVPKIIYGTSLIVFIGLKKLIDSPREKAILKTRRPV